MSSFLSEASLLIPDTSIESAWIEHAPFAFWLLDVQRPKLVVEVAEPGSPIGSLMVFADGISKLSLTTRTVAVVNTSGEDDPAVTRFEDKSVDLLQIEGRRSEVNEKERFEAWIRKLSDSGVVLVHGTQSEAVNHGTPKLFEDLKLRFPSFEFVHGDGLGIVGVGAELPPTLAEFLAIGRKPKQMEHIGRIYGQLGKRLQEIERMKTAALENERELERLNSAISVWRSESDRLRTALSRAQAEAERVRGLLSAAQQDTGRALLEVEQSLAERSRLQVALSDLAKERNRLQAELDGVVSSTSWRLTAPLRRFGNRTPSPKKLEQS